MTTTELERVVSEVEVLLERRRRLLEVLRGFEERYGVSTRDFVEAWRRGELPEPCDPDTLTDFLSWETAYEALRRVEDELRRILNVSS